MARCQLHRAIEPCYYCERGIPSFEHLVSRIEYLEIRMRDLELADRTVFNLDIPRCNGVVRMGGLGDLVILSSSLKALKAKDPKRPLVLVTKPAAMDVFREADYLDAVLSVDAWAEAGFYRRFDLRYAVEPPGIGPGKLPWSEYKTKDRSDVFDDLLGVKGTKQFSVPVNEEALEKVQFLLRSLRPPLIGLAPTCNSPIRVMPPDYVSPLSQLILQETTGTVVLLGKVPGWDLELTEYRAPRVLNLIDQLSVREFIAAVSLMNMVISPDTSTTHIAGALGVPCLALFGNISPKTRIRYYRSVHALYPEGELPCIPCWDRPPPPCASKIPARQFGGPCMRLLTPERIVAALCENLLKVAA